MTGKKLLWAAGLMLCWAVAPTVLSTYWGFQDYFQDWASARNWWEDVPIYSPHSQTVPRYLGVDFEHLGDHKLYSIVATVKANAHPPSSVLIYIPFALVPYRLSFLLWNLVSVGCMAAAVAILVRELAIALSPRALALLAVLGFAGGPVFEQMFFGQSNTLTLLFLVLAWQANRKGRQTWEGCFLGAAIALKLYPLVLLAVPLGGRRWRSLAAALATVIGFVGLSLALFGPDIWSDYARIGLPEAVAWSDLWANASLSAFWRKLFLSQNKGIPVALHCPIAFWIGYVLSLAAVGLTTLGVILRTRSGRPDAGYSVASCAMLLLSPTCWPHYFLAAILPLALLWPACRQAVRSRRAFVTCLILLFLPPGAYLLLCGIGWDDTTFLLDPFRTITGVAMQTYALLGIWLLAVMDERGRLTARRDLAEPSHGSPDGQPLAA
jgi:hypothetical protein